MEYLRKQLISLDQQTYPSLRVLIFDDCLEERCDQHVFQECLQKVPYTILPYAKENLGYTKAFETLTKASCADIIAFCDQDDVWHPDKIARCVDQMEKDKTLVVVSDRTIIDEHDQVLCDSLRASSHAPQDCWHSFDDICKYNIFIAYAVGMSMVVDGDFAKSTLPFSTYTGHDKWVLACASAQGKISMIETPLVQYRRHGTNVSGTLKNIYNKQDYRKQRVDEHIGIVHDFEKKYPAYKDLTEIKRFAYARKHHKLADLIKYRSLSPDVAKFEIALIFVPNFLFKTLLKLVQKRNDKILK